MIINKISILLPVYNTPGDWLTKSIQSILNQTYKDFDLLILDDASTNSDTQQTLVNLEKIDSRISIIRNKFNQGIAKTLNKGLLLSTNQWIARMDSDDIAHPERLKEQIKFLNKNETTSILGANIQCFGDSNNTIHYPSTHKEIATSMLWGCQIAHPTAIYNKDVILSVGGYPEDKKNAEDYALWVKILMRQPLAKFQNLPNILLDYRVQKHREEYHKIQQSNSNIICKTLWESYNLNYDLHYLLQRSLSKKTNLSINKLEKDLREFLLSIDGNLKIDEDLLKSRVKNMVSKFLRHKKVLSAYHL